MVNFKSDDRRRRDSRNRGRQGRPRSRSGGRDNFRRNSRGSERRPVEMHDVICDKCKKKCQVPFKPSKDKPVLCSECFEKSGGSSRSSGPRGRNSSSGVSPAQLKRIEEKLDKIIDALKIDSE